MPVRSTNLLFKVEAKSSHDAQEVRRKRAIGRKESPGGNFWSLYLTVEKKAWSNWEQEHAITTNSCLVMELGVFVPPRSFRFMRLEVKKHMQEFKPPLFLNLTHPVLSVLFISPLSLTFWVSFQAEVSNICHPGEILSGGTHSIATLLKWFSVLPCLTGEFGWLEWFEHAPIFHPKYIWNGKMANTRGDELRFGFLPQRADHTFIVADWHVNLY